MAEEKKAGGPKKGKSERSGDRKRLNYLRVHVKELKNEMQAVKKETLELREKLGANEKKKGKGAAAADDDDDE